jgi:tryptophanyl-tRNA synthetase
MDCYFGVRPTSEELHIGHMMTLFNMFDFIRKNYDDIENVYILLAELHAEISNKSTFDINNFGNKISNQIISLYIAYFDIYGIDVSTDLHKIKFIKQNFDVVKDLHVSVTYKFLPLVNTNYLLRNPIFKENTENSIAFLIYPILQAFDILLYAEQNKEIKVFVGNDQRANVNTVKDVIDKLNLNNYSVTFDLYENVLYDSKNENKMSKSLGNTVLISDINGIEKYIRQYKTDNRPTIHSVGSHKQCPMYKNLGVELQRLFGDLVKFNFEKCDVAKIGCGSCKNDIISILTKILNKYLNICDNQHNLHIADTLKTMQNHEYICHKIDQIRSKNENS